MAWLDVFTSSEIRPTRPTSENFVGRLQPIERERPSDTSDTSDQKKRKNIFSEKTLHREEKVTQNSTENPLSVRLFPESIDVECEEDGEDGREVGRAYNDNDYTAEDKPAAEVDTDPIPILNDRGEFSMLAYLERWGAILTLAGGCKLEADLSGMRNDEDRAGAQRSLDNPHMYRQIVADLRARAGASSGVLQ